MNTLYFGDNLEILKRYIKDETVDLIYLDPPFKSNQDYNFLFAEHIGTQSKAQIKAFEDTWRWDREAAVMYEYVVEQGGKVSEVMQAFRKFLGTSDMLAYLSMMAPRLVEMKRVLKSTGSIYLHCDPTASHYLKMLMDAVFGGKFYRNEIIWKRMSAHGNVYKSYGKVHDIILFYTKPDKATWNSPRQEHDPEYIKKFFRYEDEKGLYRKQNVTNPASNRPNLTYEWKGHTRVWKWTKAKMGEMDKKGLIGYTNTGMPYLKQYLKDTQKPAVQDIWLDITSLQHAGKERLGYPTQKPVELLERIIEASSNKSDTILDPFCGCGTTIDVAQKLKRKWIGIDITNLAITLIKHRLSDSYGGKAKYEVIGEPVDMQGATELAKSDPYQFQWWALGLVDARPVEQKKGGDQGIDGRIYFHDEKRGKTKQIIFSVKSGKKNIQHIRELHSVITRENAEIGVLICMQEPTKQMIQEGSSAGFYESSWGKHPKLQILTIQELMDGKNVDRPPARQVDKTFKKAPKHKSKSKENNCYFDFGE